MLSKLGTIDTRIDMLGTFELTTQQTRVLPGLHSEMHQYTEKWFTSEKKAATHNLAKEIAKINSRMHDGGQHSIDTLSSMSIALKGGPK